MTPPPAGRSTAQGDRHERMMGGGHYESFVIRVLVSIDGDMSRGQVTHVASGQRLYFTEPEHVPELIRRLAIASAARRDA